MKTLYQRQQELERLRSRPFQLAEALANDVRGYCEERRLYAVTVDAKSEYVSLITQAGRMVIRAVSKKSLDPAEVDRWWVDGGQRDRFRHDLRVGLTAAELAGTFAGKELHHRGLSYRKIGSELAAQGHVTRTGKPHVASAVQKMLGN
jgi:hypothetical protein